MFIRRNPSRTLNAMSPPLGVEDGPHREQSGDHRLHDDSSITEVSRTERGQALVETALALLILIIILMGVLDLGRVYFTYLAMQDAVGEGAAYGLIHPTWQYPAGAPDNPHAWPYDNENPDPNNIKFRAQNESPSALLDWAETRVIVDAPFASPGNPLTVTMEFDYDLITPIMQAVFGDQITVRATAIQIVMSSDLPLP